MHIRALIVSTLFSILLLGLAPSSVRLDGGLLDAQWLGVAGTWRAAHGIDYLWVKPGFTLAGRTLRLEPWPAPVFLNGERDSADSSLATRLTDSMPDRLERALSDAGIPRVSRTEGDIRVTGRFVDCNAGSRVMRLMAGAQAAIANATWDIKLVDAATGETVAAVHHRGVSGVDSRNLSEKIDRWLRHDFAPALHDDLAIYKTAEAARD